MNIQNLGTGKYAAFDNVRARIGNAYEQNSVTKIPVPAEIENFLGVLTGKPAFLLGHIARSLLLGLYGARGAPGRTMLIG